MTEEEIKNIEPVYENLPIDKPEEKFLEQLNPEELILSLEHLLRGERFDPEKGIWVKNAYSKRIINDKGIADIIFRMKLLIDTNTVYSDLKDNVITNIALDFAEDLADHLALHYKEYDMNVIDIRSVTKICTYTLYVALRRARDATTLRILRSVIQTKEFLAGQIDRSMFNKEEKLGFFAKLFRKK